ncbi:MAG TPA: prepilin-type N-terminal cleavage/methylation domain-containing protein [Candidatus Paceibacterota bacterium]|nr:prepilin-type N-terminal cleavage/methylation domain-containing protein [Candidatus Paceibacterota bacterium]
MLTSSTSRTSSSSPRGFTLVELLVSVAIIGIVTSIVLVKYNSFDSNVLLKSAAYEMALNLREAQVRSVSVARNETSFDYPFGVSVPVGKTYQSFRYLVTDEGDPSYKEFPVYGEDTEDIRTFFLDRSMVVGDLCIDQNGTETCGLSRLDISFRRPKFKGLFHVDGFTQVEDASIDSGTVKLTSATPGSVYAVKVTNLGQISVYKE